MVVCIKLMLCSSMSFSFKDNQRKIEPKEGGGGGGWHNFKEVI